MLQTRSLHPLKNISGNGLTGLFFLGALSQYPVIIKLFYGPFFFLQFDPCVYEFDKFQVAPRNGIGHGSFHNIGLWNNDHVFRIDQAPGRPGLGRSQSAQNGVRL